MKVRHFKGGTADIGWVSLDTKPPADVVPMVQVVHTETLEVLPLYFSPGLDSGDCWLYNPNIKEWLPSFVIYWHAGKPSGKLWARPLDNFMETVPGRGYRFERVEK